MNKELNELKEELASLVRVRNRLASTPDSNLPRILAALLPRLLSRVDRNALALSVLLLSVGDEEEEEEKMRKDIQNHQTGILSHVTERVRSNEYMSVLYLETVSAFLRSSCCEQEGKDEGGGGYSSYGRNFALALIQVGLPHCLNAVADAQDQRYKLVQAALASSLCAVEYFYQLCRRRHSDIGDGGTLAVGATEEGSASNKKSAAAVHRTPLFNASWVVLDCACILSAVRPLWEESKDNSGPTTRMGDGTTESSSTMIAEASSDASNIASSRDGGAGVFDLFLDILLFDPKCLQHDDRGRRRRWRVPDISPMSSFGMERMKHRTNSLINSSRSGDIDLTSLKLACLKYAVWPVKRGLFRPTCDDDKTGLTRALILLVLTGYGTYTSKVGQTARAYLESYLNQQKLKKDKKGDFVFDLKDNCTVSMACSLLILALGDAAAVPILEQHAGCKDVWECIIGQRPATIHRGAREVIGADGRNARIPHPDDAMDIDGEVMGEDVNGADRRGIAIVNGNLEIEAMEEDANNAGNNGEEDEFDERNDDDDDDTFISNLARKPLPSNAAASAIDFVARYFISPDVSAPSVEICSAAYYEKSEVRLLVDLALRAGEYALGLGKTQRMERGQGRQRQGVTAVDPAENLIRMLQGGTCATLSAGARIIRAVSAQLLPMVEVSSFTKEDLSWIDILCRRCLSIAIKVLTTIPSIGTAQTGRVWDAENERGPNRRPWAAAQDNIIRHHREMRQRYTGPALPEGVRVAFYDLIRNFAGRGIISLDNGICSFTIPILLFRCMEKEEIKIHGNIAAALGALLEPYRATLRSQAKRGFPSSGYGNDSKYLAEYSEQHLAAPLLPPLLSAACSESHAARMASARWSAEIIQLLDPLASQHLCSFLVDDADRDISKVAKMGIAGCQDKLKGMDEPLKSTESAEMLEQSAVVMFLDYTNDMDKEVLFAKLDLEISALSAQVNIPESAASILLRHFKFSRANAVSALLSDRDGTLERCGIAARCSFRQHSLNHGIMSERSVPPDARTELICEICFDDDLALEDMFSLPCKHNFCRGCWTSYIENEFDDGVATILDCTCPTTGCHERVTEEEVRELAPDRFDTWRNQRFASFVDMEPHHRWCPGPDCKMIGVSDTASGTANCTGCDTQFCFACGERAHLPASCANFERWNKVFSSSKCWIAKNSKPCPGCHVPVEKHTGCNHMHCPQCDSHFCWVCLALISGYGELASHLCNKYDPAKHQTSESRDVFYALRFQAHDEAETFAKQHSIDNYKNGPFYFSVEEKTTFKEAAKTVVASRHFLKFSYVIAYSMLDDPKRRVTFEKQQGALEMLTEKLSGLMEINLETLRSQEGERALCIHFKIMSFHTSSVRKYAERMQRTI